MPIAASRISTICCAGGYPFIFDNGAEGFVVHLYSRKHGDMERDYNFFSLAPEYYSQGNGNFRDMNQNRRNDVFFSIPRWAASTLKCSTA
ncbi:hypothetical protein ACFTAO_51225 [Paenibacillus rhizoplanae]